MSEIIQNATDSSPTTSEWVTHFRLLLPNTGEKAVLMSRIDQGWQLPALSASGGWFAESEWVCRSIRDQLGWTFDFTVLRYTQMAFNEEEKWDRVTLVLEAHSSVEPMPDGCVWIDLDTLAQMPLIEPAERAIVQEYLTTVAVPDMRAPWAIEGWFADASTWMEEQLIRLGMAPTGPIQQLKNWSLSAILRAPTAQGQVYLKATAVMPLFTNEGALMAQLAQLYPANIPAPLAIEPESQWMLLADFGPSVREKDPERQSVDFGSVFECYGRLQQEWSNHLALFTQIGCAERGLEHLAAQIESLFADSETERCMSQEEVEKLQHMVPRLIAMCEQLAEYKLPATLLHGDLHLGNVARPNEEYLFFDWSDGCIAHPFFDCMELYWSENQAAQERYLALWTQYEPIERLQEAWKLAYPLLLIHQGVSFQSITYGVEELVRLEVSDGISDFLRKLLPLELPK